MKELTALIVDDEKNAREGLSSMINQYIPDIKVVGQAASAQEASDIINTSPPDIIFLDIIMPGGNGFELLKEYSEHHFQVIFTTAYKDYAIQAIKFSALDYLLKPIDVGELQEAVQKARQNIQMGVSNSHSSFQELETNLTISSFGKVAIPTSEGLNIIQTQKILYIEASGSYSQIHFTDNSDSLLISKRLGEFEDLLKHQPFFRINRSYFININCIEKYVRGYGGYVVMSDGAAIDVPSKNKNKLLTALEQF